MSERIKLCEKHNPAPCEEIGRVMLDSYLHAPAGFRFMHLEAEVLRFMAQIQCPKVCTDVVNFLRAVKPKDSVSVFPDVNERVDRT